MGAANKDASVNIGTTECASKPHLRDLQHAASSSHSDSPQNQNQNLLSCALCQSLLHLTKAQWERPSIPEVVAFANGYYCCD